MTFKFPTNFKKVPKPTFSKNAIFPLLGLLLAITIFGLECAYQMKTLQNTSIAQSFFNKVVSFSGINVAVFVIGIIYLTFLLFFLFDVSPEDKALLFISTISCLLLQIPREAINYKFTICFNYENNVIVICRSILSILFVFVMISFHVKLFFDLGKIQTSQNFRKAKTLIFIFSLGILATIAALNILVLIKLKPQLEHKIGPSTIDIGYFSPDEMLLIKNGTFQKDQNFEKN